MKFFISAENEAGTDWIATEVSADTFEDAVDELRRRAQQRWPGEVWHPTSVTASPDLSRRGPVALALQLERRAA